VIVSGKTSLKIMLLSIIGIELENIRILLMIFAESQSENNFANGQVLILTGI